MYRWVPAISFLCFCIREAVFLDKSMLLMRAFKPFSGARACTDGDTVDICGTPLQFFGPNSARDSVTSSAVQLIERIIAALSTRSALCTFISRDRHVYKAKKTSKSAARGSRSRGEIQETQAHIELGGRMGFSRGMGRDQRHGRVGNY